MLFHRKNFTLLCLLAGSSRLAFFHSWLPMMTRIRSMTSAPMSQYIFCSSLMYHIPLSIRMAPTSAARASTHRMTAATRLPVALFLLAAVTTAGRLLVLPVEASTNSRSTFFFSAKLGHSFSISITKIGRNADFIVPSMRQMRKAFFVEKGQPPEAAPGGADYSSSRRSSSTRASARASGGEFHCAGLANLAVLKQKERPRPALGIAAGVGMGKVTWQNGRSRSSRSCASPSRRRWNRPDGR